MILTLHGKKRVIASDHGGRAAPPRSTFSQVAYLDGTTERLGKLVLFKD